MLPSFADTPQLYLEASVTDPIPTPAPLEYAVQGMSCDHCVVAVREEVAEVPGVSAVEVDLASGRMRVAGAGVDDAAVRAAVAEAGYEVVA